MLSIVIPTLNRPDSLVKLVESFERQIINPNEFEILVVYNNPDEALQTPLPKNPRLQILCAPQPGVNYARNRGAQAASGDVILFIDDDCMIEDPYFLQKHLDYHQSYTQMVALGGPYQIPQSASLWDRIYQKNNQNWLEVNRVSKTQTFALLGGNTSYKASVFKNGFHFTEEITYGGSETPLNTLLALKYGPLGYFSDLVITHKTSLHVLDLWRKAYRQGQGAALQTKLYGHQLQQTTEVLDSESGLLRWGLELYGFLFMASYKSHLLGKKMFTVLAQEFWARYILKKKEHLARRCEIAQQKYTGQARAGLIKAYWWQYSHIRHPLVLFLNRAYWWIYRHFSQASLLLKKIYWFLYHLGLETYWFIYRHFFRIFSNTYYFFYNLFCSAYGFFATLFEPLPSDSARSLFQRLQQRLIHISKKMAWLGLKTVGLR